MTRPRGFVDWNPQKRTVALLEEVNGVLEEYQAHLPLTIRQVFYRLVGKGAIGKTEKAYTNLCEMLNRARRGGYIEMEDIRDDGLIGGYGSVIGYEDKADFLSDLESQTSGYTKDRQQGQENRLVLWCEAGGMVPQMRRVADPYGVTVKSSGGFDSVTVKHGVAEITCGGGPTMILHVGDYDPSGECMFDALAEDVERFAMHYGNEVEFYRLAVTPEQIEEHGLATTPPKASTHQLCKMMSATTQAEALDPATLAKIVKDRIEAEMDLGIYREVVREEGEERKELMALLDQWGES